MVELIYLYIPVACLLLSNLVLFIVTASKIKQVKRETSVIRKGDSKKHSKFDDDKDR
jgi:G protein-coupled receptor Mth (Methuselah protein)